jgi:hypothetical protein
MSSRLRSSDGRFRSEDDADFVGPLRVLVAGGLAYMLWVALRPHPNDAAAALPAASTPSSKGS